MDLLNTGYNTVFNYNEIPIQEAELNQIALNSCFVAIINKSLLEENERLIDYITELTERKQKLFLLNNGNSSLTFPETWGEFRFIDIKEGCNIQILNTIKGTASQPIGEILDPKKDCEERNRLKEEERAHQQLMVQKQKEEQEKVKRAHDSAGLRKYKRKINFLHPEEMILEEEFNTKEINKAINYLIGKDVPKDGERAYSIFNKILTEEPDNHIAEYYKGVCLYFNFGLNKEENPAASIDEIFGNASEQNIVPAIILTGTRFGLNPETASEGSKILSNLQTLGYPKAKYYIGLGKELEGNLEEAIELYYSAAEENIPEAQNALGCLYAEGLGVKQNFEIASQWFELAKSKNLHEASVNLDNLTRYTQNSIDSKKHISIKLPSWKKTIDNLRNLNLEHLKNIDKQQVKEKSKSIKDKTVIICKEVLLQSWDNLNSLIDWSKTKITSISKRKK